MWQMSWRGKLSLPTKVELYACNFTYLVFSTYPIKSFTDFYAHSMPILCPFPTEDIKILSRIQFAVTLIHKKKLV
jgi:hypothetical protein